MAAAPLGVLARARAAAGWRERARRARRRHRRGGRAARRADRRRRPVARGRAVAHDHRARQCRAPLGRAGARAGDALYVTGRARRARVPRSRAARAARAPSRRDRARFAAPVPRIAEARWLAEHGAHGGDRHLRRARRRRGPHRARRAACALEIDARRDAVRRRAIARRERRASGEEYELLVAVAGRRARRARVRAARSAFRSRAIGQRRRAGRGGERRGRAAHRVDLARGPRPLFA